MKVIKLICIVLALGLLASSCGAFQGQRCHGRVCYRY